MKLVNFARILMVVAALSAYSAWSLAQRERTAEAAREPQSVPAGEGIPLIELPEAEQLWRKPGTLFVDVRSAIDYHYGHIEGAVHLPEEEFDKTYPALQPKLERAPAIVVYCKSRDCGKSLWCAIRLRQHGLTQTRIFPAGWNEWDLHGLPAVKSAKR